MRVLLPCAGVLHRQPECSRLKDSLQFLTPALALKIIFYFFFFDAEIGRVISRDTHVFGAGICIEKIVWVP